MELRKLPLLLTAPILFACIDSEVKPSHSTYEIQNGGRVKLSTTVTNTGKTQKVIVYIQHNGLEYCNAMTTMRSGEKRRITYYCSNMYDLGRSGDDVTFFAVPERSAEAYLKQGAQQI
ncbi:MAG: hypothetical protein GDA50_08925 [Alphaproteobacteria bacterium GM202ARS2]|nr:hypothetical protein [Alphaproteobacteria bacterium GM202ARS2]